MNQKQDSGDGMESVLHEDRKFPPPSSFSANAHIKSFDQYDQMYRESIDNPEKFWGEKAAKLHWFKKWSRVLEWNLPDAKWFVGGQTNLCYNCVDRQVIDGLGDKTAIVWEGEPGDTRTLTYIELSVEVCRFANALKKRGVRKGDRVAIYLPIIPEAAIAMLACARIGAPHSVVCPCFSS